MQCQNAMSGDGYQRTHASTHASTRGAACREARNARGFTLIELLVAIALLAVVAVLAWRGLDQIVRGREILTRSMESERALSQLFDQVQADLQRSARDDTVGGPAVRIAAGVGGAGGQLTIVRTLVLDGQPQRLQVVRYRLQNGRVLRIASPGLASVGQLRATLDGGSDAGSSVVDLVGPAGALVLRAYVPGQGWVDGMSGIDRAFKSNLAALNIPNGGGPIRSSVTGVELRLVLQGQAGVYSRVFLVGQ
jgi:general secretion pathway protein J